MGFLDNLLKRKQPKVKIEQKPVIPEMEKPVKIEQKPVIPEMEKPVKIEEKQAETKLDKPETQAGTQGIDLTKKIQINLSKLNLDKADVRAKRIFALDTSGSMDEKVDKRPKIEHLREVMSKIPDARKFCFSSDIYTGQDIPDPDGGTNLAKALRHIKDIEQKPERIVLVSDGLPNSETDALREATQLAIPIDIIFIGEKGGKGEIFMEKLAQSTGGQHFVV